MRTLAIGDIHAPVTHPGYRRFCMDVRLKYKTNRVVFIGDIIDWHGISYHAHHPDAPGVLDEYNLALACVRKWYRAFPKAEVMIGNHDARVARLAESVNIPARFIRAYDDVWKTPNWDWKSDTTIDDTYYFHGRGYGGIYPHATALRHHHMNVVLGHIHTAGGIYWECDSKRRMFGMSTGCGIDDRAAAMAYGHYFKRKSLLGCGVVIDGHPYHEMMRCGPGEKYHRSNFEKGG